MMVVADSKKVEVIRKEQKTTGWTWNPKFKGLAAAQYFYRKPNMKYDRKWMGKDNKFFNSLRFSGERIVSGFMTDFKFGNKDGVLSMTFSNIAGAFDGISDGLVDARSTVKNVNDQEGHVSQIGGIMFRIKGEPGKKSFEHALVLELSTSPDNNGKRNVSLYQIKKIDSKKALQVGLIQRWNVAGAESLDSPTTVVDQSSEGSALTYELKVQTI